VSGLSPEQIRYVQDVLGLRNILLSRELVPHLQPVTPAPQPRTSEKLIVLFATTLSTAERELAGKMFQAMKLTGKDLLTIENSNDPTTLQARIDSTDAKVILAFGIDATKFLSTTAELGAWGDHGARRVLATHAPIEMLQNPDLKKTTWAHLQNVMKAL
jgi:hypothetical protein